MNDDRADSSESEGEDLDILSEEKQNRILSKIYKPFGYYKVKKVLKRHLPRNTLLCERLVEKLQLAIDSNRFDIGDSIAHGLVFSQNAAFVIKPIMHLLTCPERNYDIGYNEGFLLSEFGPEAIPYISNELYHIYKPRAFVVVMALGMIYDRSKAGKEEIIQYLHTLSDDEWESVVDDSLLSDEIVNEFNESFDDM